MASKATKVYYYGKKNNFVGKTLFEILANLRDYGLNRMLIKQEELLKNPGTKCYYIVKKVEPVMDEKLEQGAIYAERIYRDAKVPGLVFVDDETWQPDWQLVPRHQEGLHRIPEDRLVEHGHPTTIKVLPRWMEVPPLMDVYLRRHYRARMGATTAPVKLDTPKVTIGMSYDFKRINLPHMLHRVAEAGESCDESLSKPIQALLASRFRHNPQSRECSTDVEKKGSVK